MRSSRRLAVLIAASSAALSCVPYGVGVTVPVGVAPGPVYGPGFEVNVARPGGEYRNFDLPAPQPDMCRNQCLSDPSCLAFTYVSPGFQGPTARCWLKGAITPPVPNGCCISGVVRYGAPPPPPPPRPRAFEQGIDRPGMDYRDLVLTVPTPEVCWNECLRDSSCAAYTYVQPGVRGPNARCLLKGGVPNPQPNSCCISGVK